MPSDRDVCVQVLPSLAPEGKLRGALAVVIDVLRATTTIVTALQAGCTSVRPCAEVEEARAIAEKLGRDRCLLGGERDGVPIPGFDLGNSPLEYTRAVCQGKELVFTTTNGTRALVRAAEADRVLVAGFVNFGAVCEQLRSDPCPIHIICAGTRGEVTLEDVLVAGAFVDFLHGVGSVRLNDGARIAQDSFRGHAHDLIPAFELSRGGANLKRLGYDEDIRFAAQMDRFTLVPELKRDPLRVEIV